MLCACVPHLHATPAVHFEPSTGEHKLIYTELFNEYTTRVESALATALEASGLGASAVSWPRARARACVYVPACARARVFVRSCACMVGVHPHPQIYNLLLPVRV